MSEDEKASRFKPLPEVEVEICHRLAKARRFTCMSQALFAESLGLTRSKLANLESARVPLRFWTGWRICKLLNIRMDWLAYGEGPERPFYSIDFEERKLQIPEHKLFSDVVMNDWFVNTEDEMQEELDRGIERYFGVGTQVHSIKEVVSAIVDSLIRNCPSGSQEQSLRLIRDVVSATLADDEGESSDQGMSKLMVDNKVSTDSLLPVKTNLEPPRNWEQLRSLLIKATQLPGSKARLAECFDTTRQAVNKWLSGTGAPNADLTLRLAAWVTDPAQVQQLKSASAGQTAKAPKTRKKGKHETKPNQPSPKTK